jgi:hypothetical protein
VIRISAGSGTHPGITIEHLGAHARLDIVDWVEGYYIWQRLHTSINFHAPVGYEALLTAA